MFHKSLIIIFLKLSLLFGNDQYLSPVVKSFLVPGWGQVQNKENKRARFFYLTETLILSGYIFQLNTQNTRNPNIFHSQQNMLMLILKIRSVIFGLILEITITFIVLMKNT